MAAAVLGLMLLPLRHEQTFRTRLPITGLVEAADKLSTRTVEGRLSGRFAYKPVATPSRGSPFADSSRWNIAAAAASLDVNDAHSRGVAYLLMDDEEQAVHTLEEAARREPQNAELLNDLSVAYGTRAKVRSYVPDYTAALDAAEHAWQLRHTPEIAWNRAIALSVFCLTNAAERAWDTFLGMDADPGWRSEAQRRRGALRYRNIDDTARQAPAQTLSDFEISILPRWARARLADDEVAAANTLDSARAIAAALAADGEALPNDTVIAIEHTCSDRTSCKAIAHAYVIYAEGLRFIDTQKYAQAASQFSDAVATLVRFKNPFALAASYQHAACLIHENRFAEARAAAVSLRASVEGRGYRTLEAHIFWLDGLAMLHDAKPEESIASYIAARERFLQSHDLKNAAAIETRLADAFEYAGDRDTAMAHRLAALEAMHSSDDTSELYITLFEAGTGAAQHGWPYAGELFLAESVRESVARRRPAVAAISSMWRSMLSSRRADFSSAAEQARMAAAYFDETADPGQRALLGASAKQLAASGEMRKPVDDITETIRFVRAAENRAWLPELLRQRALLHRSDRDLAAAETDFREAIEISEQTLDENAPATMRDSFTADTRANYEDLIRLLLDRGAWRDALAYAERARLIGQGLPANGGRDVLAPVVRIAPRTAAAVFEVQPDALTVWLVTRTSITVFRAREAGDIGSRLTAAVDAAPSAETLAALYDLLVREWIPHVAPGSNLVIVPPPALEGVPFAALFDRQGRRFLIDDYTVSVAPSLASAADAPVTVSPTDSLLIVGDPAYQRLPRLPKSRQETRTIADKHAHATLLLDKDATAKNLLRDIGRASVFHFAGHAVINELAPEMSSLMLAAENGDDTRLYLHELLPHHLPLKLAILSACSTAKRRAGGAPGSLNLARAFIDRGTRAVVGTLRPVSDDDSTVFSIDLYEALNRGAPVAEAVRSAQLRMKSHDNGSLAWTAFCLMTGRHGS